MFQREDTGLILTLYNTNFPPYYQIILYPFPSLMLSQNANSIIQIYTSSD